MQFSNLEKLFLYFKKSFLKKLILLNTSVFLSTTTLAMGKIQLQGAVDGGGGKAVVCKNSAGEISSIQLLDLWEANTLYDMPPQALGNTLEESVDQALLALKNSYPLKIRASHGSKTCEGQDCLTILMQDTTSKFFNPNTKLKRLRGVELTLTDDSYELAKPANCEIHQIVNYRPDSTILLNQDLFEKMSMVDQTALIAHEAYYRFLRNTLSPETNSIRTRRAIGFIMSKHVFELQQEPSLNESLRCHADGIPYAPSNIYFYRDYNLEGGKYLSIFIDDINGSGLIGAKQPFGSFGFDDDATKKLFSGTCDQNGIMGLIGVRGDGPVEFDHIFRMQWTCEDTHVKLYVTETKPGGASQTTELKCVAENRQFSTPH
jgi:hypothetical protein